MSELKPVAYVGERTPEGCKVYVEGKDGRRAELPHVVHHSPSGFEWGYNGSGPADLAHSILAYALRHRVHPRMYQQFKFTVVARLPDKGWRIPAEKVATWINHRWSSMTDEEIRTDMLSDNAG